MSKSKNNLLASLDVGSSTIRMAVGQINHSEDQSQNGAIQILGAAEVSSAGVVKGEISSIEEVVSSISTCLERVERMVGVPIDSVWVGISGTHILSQTNKGVVAVSKADSEITEEDINRALEASRAVSTPLNYEILHVLPKSFSVDGQSGIKDPVGMTGIRLEVDAQIILGSSSQVKNLTKAVYRAGLDVEDLVLSIIATSEIVVTARQKELGVIVVDLGGSTTNLAVFEEGNVIHTAVLPLGSDHITNDIAIGLRTSIDIAEKAKIEYGDCRSDMISKTDQVDLGKIGAPESESIKRKYLSEIIEARVEEIFYKIDNELKLIKRSGLLPAGIVFVGGGSKLPGITESAKKYLRLPATLGYPLDIYSVTEKVNDLGFANVLGLLKWGSLMDTHISKGFSMGSNKITGATNQIKKWIKILIP